MPAAAAESPEFPAGLCPALSRSDPLWAAFPKALRGSSQVLMRAGFVPLLGVATGKAWRKGV